MEEKVKNGVASDKNETGKFPGVSVKSRHFDKSGFEEIKNKKEELKYLKGDAKSDHLIQKTDVFHDKFTLSNSKQCSEPANPSGSDHHEQIKSNKANNVESKKHINGEAPIERVLSEGEEVSSGFETISSNDSIADYKEIGLSLQEPQCDNYYIAKEEHVFSSKYRNITKTFFNNNSYTFEKSESRTQHYIKTNRYPHQTYYSFRGYKQTHYNKMYSGYNKNYNYNDRYKWSRDKIDDEYRKEIPISSMRQESVEFKRTDFLKSTGRDEFLRYSNRSRCSRSRSRSSRSRSSSRRRSRFSRSRSRSSGSRSSSHRRSIYHKKKKSHRKVKPNYKRNRTYRRSSSSSDSSSSESSSSSYSSSSSSSSTSRGSRSPIDKAKKIKPRNGRSSKILKSNHRRNSPVKKRRRLFSKSSLSPENKRWNSLEPDVIVKKQENRSLKLLSSFPENDKIKKEKTFLEEIMKNVKIRDRSAAKVSKEKEETKPWNCEVEEQVISRIRQKSNSRFCLNYVPPSFSEILHSSNVAPPTSVDVIPHNDIPSSSNFVPPSTNNVVLSLSEVSPSSSDVPSSSDAPPSSNDAPPILNDAPPSSSNAPPILNDAPPSSNDIPPPSNDIPLSNDAPPSNDVIPSNDAPPPSNNVPSLNDAPPPSNYAPPSNDVLPSSNDAPPPTNDVFPSSNAIPLSSTDAPPSSNEVPSISINNSPTLDDVAPFPNNIPFCSYTIPRYPNYMRYHPKARRMYPWQRFPFLSTPRRSVNNLPLKRGPTGLPVHITITGEVVLHDMEGRPIPLGPEGQYQPVDRTGRLFAHILSPRNLPVPIHMTVDGVLRLPNSEPVPNGPGHRFPVDVDGSIIRIGPDSRPLGRCSNLPTLPPAECNQMSNMASTWPKRRQQLIPITPQTPPPSETIETNTHQSGACETKQFVRNETRQTETDNNQSETNKNSREETNEEELEILYEKKAREKVQKPKKNSNSNSYPGGKKLIPITLLPKKIPMEDKNLDSQPENCSKFLPDLKKDFVNKITSLECVEKILKIACDNKTEKESSTKSKDFIIKKVELALKSLNDEDFQPPKMGRFIISKYLTQPTEETNPNISPLLKNRIKLPFLVPNENEEKVQTPPKNYVAYKFLPEEITPKKKSKATKLDETEEKRNGGVKFSEFSLDFSVQCDFTTVIIKDLTSKVEKMETEVQRLRNINTHLLDGFRNVHMASEKKSEELGKALREIREKENEILSLKSQMNEKGIKETSCA